MVEHHRRRRVAEIVKTHIRQPCISQDSFEILVKIVVVEGGSDCCRKYQALVLPAVTRLIALLQLSLVVLADFFN